MHSLRFEYEHGEGLTIIARAEDDDSQTHVVRCVMEDNNLSAAREAALKAMARAIGKENRDGH